MRELRHTMPYMLEYVRAAAFDVIESVSSDATAKKEPWQIVGTVNVYGNKSVISFEASEKDMKHTDVSIKMLLPAKELSDAGQKRTLCFLADSMEQMLENTFVKK